MRLVIRFMISVFTCTTFTTANPYQLQGEYHILLFSDIRVIGLNFTPLIGEHLLAHVIFRSLILPPLPFCVCVNHGNHMSLTHHELRNLSA